MNFKLTFLTPAFLGDAAQNGRWRTPPIKHELRAWWRVAYAASKQFNFAASEMRKAEALLFGHAWLEDDAFECDGRRVTTAARKSAIRLRLMRWDVGTLKSWEGLEKGTVHHPETERTNYQVGPHAYLGFGPLDGRGGTNLAKSDAAIKDEESARLSIAAACEAQSDAWRLIREALALMNLFGTLGGRSRNGWGSYALDPTDGTPAHSVDLLPLRYWKDALDLDWPHAIGKDEKGAPLIWQTEPCDDWKGVMKTLAELKIRLRTQKGAFEFVLNGEHDDEEVVDKRTGERTGIAHGRPQDRHWIAYPVTNHKVKTWERHTLRLPNQLRFKVRKTNDGRLVGVIFHMPHLPPPAFSPNRRVIESVWQKVHRFLDGQGQKLSRISA
ncbi:MAG: hypothetical protein NZ533_09420 [Casimicrobiaceae bacterium]|nr:hypothetical protein [Casimicrobiaceae bacterium]